MGCDGFRVDMAGSLVKNDEDGKGNIALWRKVRAFLDAEFPEAVLVSEWGRTGQVPAGRLPYGLFTSFWTVSL